MQANIVAILYIIKSIMPRWLNSFKIKKLFVHVSLKYSIIAFKNSLRKWGLIILAVSIEVKVT